jgi:hypothetical protein
MGILTALKARRKGAVTERRGSVAVIATHREYPGSYVADVQYNTGTNTWRETVNFKVVPTVEGKWAVTITDTDFPKDRCHHIVIEPTVDIYTFITVYVLSGRW